MADEYDAIRLAWEGYQNATRPPATRLIKKLLGKTAICEKLMFLLLLFKQKLSNCLVVAVTQLPIRFDLPSTASN